MIFFGTLAPWQGLKTMLAAVREQVCPPEVALLIAGDGRERFAVKAAAEADANVLYIGPVAYQELPAIVSNANVALVVSENVAGRAAIGLVPLNLVETMASGVPVIVTEFPGQAEIVTDNTAVVWSCLPPSRMARPIVRSRTVAIGPSPPMGYNSGRQKDTGMYDGSILQDGALCDPARCSRAGMSSARRPRRGGGRRVHEAGSDRSEEVADA